MQKHEVERCVVCGCRLHGQATKYCSNACKQTSKYARKMGRECRHCHKPIKEPVPILGGFSQECARKGCISKR